MGQSLINLNKDRRTGDVYFDIARGCYDDATVNHKFGVNLDIDTLTDPETIWSAGGEYPWSALDTAQVLYVVVTNAGDSGTVTVEGLDENWKVVSEDITSTGAATYVTTALFKRVFRVLFTDTNDNNIGIITVRTASAAGTIVAQIDPDVSQSLMAIYSVPAGYTAYIRTIELTVDSNKVARFRIRESTNEGSWRVKHVGELQGIYVRDFSVPLVMEEKTDIDFLILETEANNTSVSANFDIVLVKN